MARVARADVFDPAEVSVFHCIRGRKGKWGVAGGNDLPSPLVAQRC
jgi:hypothetical protein